MAAPLIPAATRRHVHEGDLVGDPQSPYQGKWNAKGLHNWSGVQMVCARDGFAITEVREDPATGVRRVTIERSSTDRRTGSRISGAVAKTVYPKSLPAHQIDALAEQAFLEAESRGAGRFWNPPEAGSHRRVVAPAGYFCAVVMQPDGRPLEMEGWYDTDASGHRVIRSHAPRFGPSITWPIIERKDW